MVGAIIILLVTVSVGFVLYVYDLKWRRQHPDLPREKSLPSTSSSDPDPSDSSDSADSSDSSDNSDAESANSSQELHGEICCGRHLICDKSLSPEPGEEIIYYDDEELDRFAGRAPEAYTDDEAEEFREVLLTLISTDIAPWARSLQLRGIHLPLSVRDELFLLLEEA